MKIAARYAVLVPVYSGAITQGHATRLVKRVFGRLELTIELNSTSAEQSSSLIIETRVHNFAGAFDLADKGAVRVLVLLRGKADWGNAVRTAK